jgi:TetR/AcrR family transcriptional regulator, transcriptional repressor of bet genes
MPRASNTDERRQQIARAFLKVMAHHGYDGASIAEIARRAKLAPGLVHYHFENKLEILLAAMRELLAEHAALLDAALAGATTPAAELAAFLDVHLGLGAHSNPDALACWVQLSGEAQRQRKVRTALATALTRAATRLADIIRRGVATRAFHCAEPEAAAAALLAAIEGYFVLATTARPIVPAGSAAGCAVRMAEGLLQCKLPPPPSSPPVAHPREART